MSNRDLDPSVLPWSPESESALLGALMLNTAVWDAVGDLLEPKHFFSSTNGKIYSAIGALVMAGRPCDIVSVLAHMQSAGTADDVDLTVLNDIAQMSLSVGSARRYAEVITERALMRGLLEAADEVRNIAIEPGLTEGERLDRAQAKFQCLAANRGAQLPVAVGAMAVDFAQRVESLHRGDIEPGISCGIPGLNKRLNGGFRPGKLIILAARPAIGKSSLAMQLCINLAEAGHGAAYLSLEMPKADLMDRIGANVGKILLDNVLTGNLRECEWERLTEAVDKLKGLPLYLDDQNALTLAEVAAKGRALVRQHGIKLLVIDYLQLCGGRKGDDKRHHQLEEISRGLKSLAKQLGITIVALSQLNRLVENRVGGKPMLSDLKESGAIEEDADVVMFLSLNHINDFGAKVIEADFAKNRQGRIGSAALAFDGGFQHWTDSGEPLTRPGPGKARSTPAYAPSEEF